MAYLQEFENQDKEMNGPGVEVLSDQESENERQDLSRAKQNLDTNPDSFEPINPEGNLTTPGMSLRSGATLKPPEEPLA